MSELVDPADIEAIVGADRDPVVHQARAVSEEETVYILHSQACLDFHLAGTRDLRACPFSTALDRGINLGRWGAHQDQPLRVAVVLEELIPWHPWMACPACTGTVRETVGMVCQTCGTDYGATDRETAAEATHDPCCSAHGVPMTCRKYRRTHFVEVRPCCSADAALLAEQPGGGR